MLSSAIAYATRYPGSLSGWFTVSELRMACSIESMRIYIAPPWRASSLAMAVLPVPGSPLKMISMGRRLPVEYAWNSPSRDGTRIVSIPDGELLRGELDQFQPKGQH